jgi:hypothetical protein
MVAGTLDLPERERRETVMAHRTINAALVLAVPFAAWVAAFGCGGGEAGVAGKLPDDGRARTSTIEHEPCEESGNVVQALDANNDGKADIRKVSKNGREICRISDLNHDGNPDLFEYFDPSGQLRRREADYDDNGVVNAIEHFEAGRLVRRDLDTTNQGRIDTWDFLDPTTGAMVKRERDANGDGRIDQWWSYERGQVTIAMDRNGDGQADPGAAIVLGANGQVIVDAGNGTDAASPPTSTSPLSTDGGVPQTASDGAKR